MSPKPPLCKGRWTAKRAGGIVIAYLNDIALRGLFMR